MFITGVSRGIGLALARYYLKSGDVVYGTICTSNVAVEELAVQYPQNFHALVVDVRDDDSVRSAAKPWHSIQTVSISLSAMLVSILPEPRSNFSGRLNYPMKI